MICPWFIGSPSKRMVCLWVMCSPTRRNGKPKVYVLFHKKKGYAHGLCALPLGEIVCRLFLFFKLSKESDASPKGEKKESICQVIVWFLFG